LLLQPAFADFSNDEITIASEPDYPPYSMVDSDGEASGFAVDLFMAAAEAAGLKVTRENLYKMLQKMNFNSFVAAGPVTYSETERIGVDVQNIYVSEGGVFKKIQSFESQYIQKVRAGR